MPILCVVRTSASLCICWFPMESWLPNHSFLRRSPSNIIEAFVTWGADCSSPERHISEQDHHGPEYFRGPSLAGHQNASGLNFGVWCGRDLVELRPAHHV